MHAMHLADILLEPIWAGEIERPDAESAAPLLGWSADDVTREIDTRERYVTERPLGGLKELAPPVST
jgi:hypothetical protein